MRDNESGAQLCVAFNQKHHLHLHEQVSQLMIEQINETARSGRAAITVYLFLNIITNIVLFK